jgi:hypothetical protein
VWQLYQEGIAQQEIAKRMECTEACISIKLKMLKKRYAPMPESYEFLPEKIKKFVLAKAEGKTNIDAVFESHEVTSRESAKTIGTRLNGRADVQQAIADIMNSEGVTRHKLVRKLSTHIDSDEPNISLRGVEMGLKLHGELITSKNLNVNLNVDCHPVDLGRYL